MGKIKQGILGGFSGKVGNVIGTSWKGISVVKVMPQSVANPKTAAQVSQRNSLTFAVNFAVQILAGFIKPCWDRFAQGMSGYNDFISSNIAVFDSEVPSVPTDLVIAKGKLAPLGSSSISVLDATHIHIEYTAGDLGVYGSNDDDVYAVFLNARNAKAWGSFVNNGRLNTGGFSQQVTTLDIQDNDVIHCWLVARRDDGTMVSNAIHAQATANI